MSDWLERLTNATAQRETAQKQAQRYDERWRELIRSGLSAGVRAEDVARAAKITRARVYQIRDGRR